jgi:hypothetical protein
VLTPRQFSLTATGPVAVRTCVKYRGTISSAHQHEDDEQKDEQDAWIFAQNLSVKRFLESTKSKKKIVAK